MSDLVICKFRKSMVIHDTECPYWDQVSLNNPNLPNQNPIPSLFLSSHDVMFRFIIMFRTISWGAINVSLSLFYPYYVLQQRIWILLRQHLRLPLRQRMAQQEHQNSTLQRPVHTHSQVRHQTHQTQGQGDILSHHRSMSLLKMDNSTHLPLLRDRAILTSSNHKVRWLQGQEKF